LLLAIVALIPTVFTVMQAAAGPRELTVREKILRDLSADPTVLINVTLADMPASGDILNLGKRSTRALERCLADNVDDQMRRTCAQMLGYLGDRRALPTLHTALEDWDSHVRSTVVDVLSRIPEKSSYGPLMKLFRRKDEAPYVRAAILRALGALGSHDAVRVLRQELRNEPSEKEKKRQGDLRESAFLGLWASRHLVARTTLEQDIAYMLRSDDDSLVLRATGAAEELRSPSLVAPLTKLVDHQNVEIRNKSVHALGLIGNPAATRVLTREMPRVREARMLNNIAFALERLDKEEYEKTIESLVEHKQAIIRLNAAFVLGDVKQPDGLRLLTQALDDPNDLVKVSAIAAIGKLGAKEGVPALEKFVTSPNPHLRAEAIYALNDVSGNKRLDLIYERLFTSEYAKSPNGHQMRHRAALALGQAGDRRVREYLLHCYELGPCGFRSVRDYFSQDDSPEVTRRLYLSWAEGDRELTNEVARRRPPGMLELALGEKDSARGDAIPTRLYRSIDLIGMIGSSSQTGEIRRHLGSKDTLLRMHTAVALIRLGDASAAKQLFAELDNLPVDWLRTFVRVVGKVDEEPARTALRPELERRSRGDDVQVALACAAVLLHWDPDQGFFRFLDALSATTTEERTVAEGYLWRERSPELTWAMRRALARESRPYTRDRLRQLLDAR
jgi:HEAT repeat protein